MKTRAPWLNKPSKLQVRQQMQGLGLLYGTSTDPIEQAPIRAKRGHQEHDEQVVVATWASKQSGALADARKLFAVPNGGSRHLLEAVRLKAEGVKAGVPDLFLPVPRAPYHGLFIEMKAPKGVISDEQAARLRELAADWYLAVVAYGADEAIEAITNYLRWPA